MLAVFCLCAAAQLPDVRGQSELTYVVSTLAGKPATGVVDGVGTAASFVLPSGLAVDASGNIFVADPMGNTLRKITSAGLVTTLAGSVQGSSDGIGSAARFSYPKAVAVDAQGNLFVADAGNHTIRKISAGGVVSTVAGLAGQSGAADGNGSSARFNSPWGVAVDSTGIVYVSDSFNNTIRKIDPSGTVTTLAGSPGQVGDDNGSGAAARFNFPTQLVLDSQGNLLVTSSHFVRKITPAGVVSSLVDLTIDSNPVYLPWGLTVDDTQNVYVSSFADNTVRKITPAGVMSLYAGATFSEGEADGAPSVARFRSPTNLAADRSGNIFVADSLNARIRRISATSGVTTIAGTTGSRGSTDGSVSDARFNGPTDVALGPDGTLYVADQLNYCVRKISPSGTVSTLAGTVGVSGSHDGTGTNAEFSSPYALAVDAVGVVYVSDGDSVRKITPNGDVSTLASGVFLAGGIAVDSAQNVYVTNRFDHTVLKIGANGESAIIAGASRMEGTDDGTGSAARFRDPDGLAVDAAGNLYVADFNLRKITPAGVVTTLTHFSDEEPGVKGALAIDSAGFVYCASDDVLIRVSPTGDWTTLAGSRQTWGSSDGSGSAARFNWASGVALDGAGTLFIADRTNNTIRKATRAIAPSFSANPSSQTVDAGKPVTLGATATGTPSPTYQWFKDGKVIANATSSTYTVASATAGDAGVYTVVATNAVGSVTSQSATVSVTVRSSRLANISTRAFCGTGGNVTIGGFVITGSAPRKVLLRAVGPTLSSLGIDSSRVLADPMLEVHDAVHSNAVIASNDNWGDNANAAEITSVSAQIGANAFAATDTRSSALLLTLQPGVYTMVAAGKSGGSGIVLIEAYDADLATNGSSFVNIASRAFATAGDGVAIGGFVVTGNVAKQVLLRAVGPTLSKQGIALAELLADPTIELHDASHGNAVVATNDNWGENANAASITTTSARIGAAPFDATDTKSSALLVTLDPGVYTFIANGKASSSGVVLVEVYDAE